MVTGLSYCCSVPDIAEFKTITVVGSQVIRREQGRIAMALHTQELGVLAFDLNKAGVAALGAQIINAAQLLNGAGSK